MSRAAVLSVVALFLVCGRVSGQEEFREELKSQFRVRCDYSHSANDDPILKPNQPGRSHSHDFLGFTGTNARTTDATKFIGKPTTCTIKEDAAAYWFPSLYQRRPTKERNGRYGYDQITPEWSLFYYRIAVGDPRKVRTIPANLTMVTGNPLAGLRQQKYVNVEWWCGTFGKHFNNFPQQSCARNVALIGKLNFPTCWDGRRTSSPDGKSHMAHIPLGGNCPPSHPVAIPRISIKLYYRVRAGLDLRWPAGGRAADPPVFLSTYYSGGSGSGLEYHADFMNGWEARKLQSLITTCINSGLGCTVQNDTKRISFDDGPGCGRNSAGKPLRCL